MSIARSVARAALLATIALLPIAGCRSVPTGAGAYMVTVSEVESGKRVEGLAIVATGTGSSARGAKPAMALTDEDGVATLAFGNWGAIDLQLVSDEKSIERWLVTQGRVAVNGGKSSIDPLRLMVGADGNGGTARYKLSITRVEKGPAVDN